MGKAKNANRPLSQEEIWDDSALVQSWDEAVEEYKLYHSIHAKGENVEDVLREAEAAERAGLDQDGQQPDEAVDAMEDDDAAAATASATAEQSSSMQVPDAAEEHPTPTDHQPSGPKHPTQPAPVGGAAMPHAALAQVQDEGLKNLMMAWYFAGYYTGLYEGQQRASQNNNS
ncbi:survival motor neuron-like protein 1 [Aspergillus lentulus]|uniref:Survival motor neuron-like protein 1 n=1 Tax=Aspergillus lentulus TaxID=293939 RepID=A0AAN4PJI4_ASPLE|nr:survival motor neuron-like protein 1 [Aspergillus lentulus]